MAGNGQVFDPALAAAHMPLVGQPQIVGATVIATVKCPCGTHPINCVSQFVGQQWMSMPMVCTFCQTPYSIAGVRSDEQGRLTFDLAIGAKPSLV